MENFTTLFDALWFMTGTDGPTTVKIDYQSGADLLECTPDVAVTELTNLVINSQRLVL